MPPCYILTEFLCPRIYEPHFPGEETGLETFKNLSKFRARVKVPVCPSGSRNRGEGYAHKGGNMALISPTEGKGNLRTLGPSVHLDLSLWYPVLVGFFAQTQVSQVCCSCAHCSTVTVSLGLAVKTMLTPLFCLPRILYPLKSPGISLKTKPQSYGKKKYQTLM